MQKIFLDTNVILDFVLHRDGEIQAMDILQMGEDEKISLCTSFLSMANIAYILRKLPQKELYRMLSLLTLMFDVLPMTKEHFTKALQIENVDFEDVLQ
ncbi:MAG: PIN domain-containing protein, partial [Bacteroidales bacterium]|nr:PIN domain-containing protein [Bacteroidales bacterium]